MAAELQQFSEASKACALKFLEEFTGNEVLPSGEEPLPLRTIWPQLERGEMEGECLDIAKRYLAQKKCPGLLSYHIAAEACLRLNSVSLDQLRCSSPDAGAEGNQSASELDGCKVARQLLVVLLAVCKEWLSQFPVLSAPADKTEMSMFGMKNTRRKMEDRYAICLDVNSLYGLKGMPAQTYYAVYDGHNGEAAAVYASIHLLTNIVRNSAFQNDLATAIKEGIRITDENFCKKDVRSGSTAVLTFLRGDKLYVGWLGDSQALLVRGGTPLQLVDAHKPEREDEQKRIEDAGGMVIWLGVWRVNGNLSVSRAIGDAKDKQFVIGQADVATFDLHGSEDYLVVACDGLWDVLSGEEVSQCVTSHLASSAGSRQTVARALVQFAKAEGSGDNITAIVVYFKGFEGGQEESCDSSPDKEVTLNKSCDVSPELSCDSSDVS